MSLGPAAPWKCGNVDVEMKMKTFDEGAAALDSRVAVLPGGFLRQLRRGAFYWAMACWARIKPAR